jgi:hypothetical protein
VCVCVSNNNTHKKAKQSVASGLSCQGYLVEKSPWNRPGGGGGVPMKKFCKKMISIGYFLK